MIYTLRALKLLLFHPEGFFRATEFFDRWKSPRIEPWFTFPAVELLKDRIGPTMTVFEWGSGYSTLFWARRCNEVVAYESSHIWANKIEKMIEAEGLSYCGRVVRKGINYYACMLPSQFIGMFDIVVVDGRVRMDCLRNASNLLTRRGVVILDDSNRKEYQEGIEDFLEQNPDFRMLRFQGLKQRGFKVDETAIFYRSGNCLKI